MSHNEWRRNRHLPVLTSRPDAFYGRLEVDVSNTAFQEGKEFRISYEFQNIADTPRVLRFTCPVDFILQYQNITSDLVGVRYKAWRSTQGTAGGTFGTPVPIWRQNFTDQAKDLDPLTTIDAGGTFTPSGGESSTETLRVRVANATAQQTTVDSSVGDERGVGAGTYYLVIERIPGATGNAAGVLTLRWEEIRVDE